MESPSKPVHGTGALSALSKTVLLFFCLQCVTSKTLKYQVYEEQRVGTVIARLQDNVADVLAQFPETLSFRFRAMQRVSVPLLRVREADGEISIAARIDREKQCGKHLNCSIEFDVLTLPTEHLQLFHVQVEVLDINDNAPRFSRAALPVELSESASVGTRVPLDGAVDADVGQNSLHTYSLTPNDFFEIEVRTRLDGAKYAELVVTQELDRETRSSFQLQLTASDNGVPPKSGSTVLTIDVSDSNDNSPAFDRQVFVVELAENAPVGTLIIDLNATDPDEGSNGKIVYAFSAHVSPQILQMFKTDPDTGHVTLTQRVDYENTASYELDVQAQDLGPNSVPCLCKILVKVVDVNDNAPHININLMTPGTEEVAYISEGAPADTFVALVRVGDEDTGLNGEVLCRLHGHGHFRLQRTYEKNYMILTNASLDREKRSEYSLTVVAEDQGSPSLANIKHLTVKVLDENDNPPQFQKSHYDVFKSENNSPGAYIMTVAAEDPDLGANGQVTYSIVDSQVHGSPISTYVTVDPSNGAIYALRSFDHEDVSLIRFSVQAQDGGDPALSANTSVLLTVLDENDNPPVVLSPALHNHTAELVVWRSASPGQQVMALMVTDRDAGANGEIVCSITGGDDDGLFVMDPQLCELRTNASLEQFPRDVVEITVEVQDRGASQLSTGVTLRLTLQANMCMLPLLCPTGTQDVLDLSLIVIISLGSVCALLLVVMVMFATTCSSCEKEDPRRSYSSCVAESSYQNQPKTSTKQIHKADITLVPARPVQVHPDSLSGCPIHDQGSLGRGRGQLSHPALSMVATSSGHVAESFALELSTPPVERVSQLLSVLHQGQYHPRPSFRGNKYARSYRYVQHEMDKFSLKDSEAGDSDCEAGRESPMEALLALRLCTEDCRVLGHSDQCWMPLHACPEAHWPTEQCQEQPRQLCTGTSPDHTFCTFGKEGEECGENAAPRGEGIYSPASRRSETKGVFQPLLAQALDSLDQVNDQPEGTRLSGEWFPMTGSLDRRQGHLPGKRGACGHQQQVWAWAANTHFQNLGSLIESPGQMQIGRYHTLKPSGHSSGHSNPPAEPALPSGPLHGPTTKWLPAMEEIPENYEEDDFDSGLGHLKGKRSESRHELVAENNKEDS
ncbi:protocadherin-18-like [Neosynchiropus ocellatus]